MVLPSKLISTLTSAISLLSVAAVPAPNKREAYTKTLDRDEMMVKTPQQARALEEAMQQARVEAGLDPTLFISARQNDPYGENDPRDLDDLDDLGERTTYYPGPYPIDSRGPTHYANGYLYYGAIDTSGCDEVYKCMSYGFCTPYGTDSYTCDPGLECRIIEHNCNYEAR